jgi:hypothetical protein
MSNDDDRIFIPYRTRNGESAWIQLAALGINMSFPPDAADLSAIRLPKDWTAYMSGPSSMEIVDAAGYVRIEVNYAKGYTEVVENAAIGYEEAR